MCFRPVAIMGLACVISEGFPAVGQSPPATRIVVVDRVGPRAIPEMAGRGQGRAAGPSTSRIAAGNEAAVIDICFTYVEAQFVYFRTPHASDGYLNFAARIRSSDGKRDGIYWPLDGAEEESPMGPRFAAAALGEDQPAGSAHSYFGYYFKILVGQGAGAPGGARDYRVDGRLIGGFGLLAWPAEYGVTGVRSFIVNHLGDVFAQDLGPGTPRAAAVMTLFAPDRNWTKVGSADRTEGLR